MSGRDESGADIRLPVGDPSDVVMARLHARRLAVGAGLPVESTENFVTAMSEVADNMLVHAGGGEITLSVRVHGGRRCIEAVARDHGPGIEDTAAALRDGWSTRQTLGLGLSSARRLVDELEIESDASRGTTVSLRTWCPAPAHRLPGEDGEKWGHS